MRKLFSVLVLSFFAAGCGDIGFHELDVTQRNKASEQTARDVMAQVQAGLHQFYEMKHHYPNTTEAHLYDSIRNYMNPQMDPVHLYRNEIGKGYFIAIGGRANKVVYRYPSTIGPGDYTLYWVGVNGIDEDGDGDDIDAWETPITQANYERHRIADLNGDKQDDRLIILRTGPDLFRDSVRFSIKDGDNILYQDSWPLSAYFRLRPELSDADRKRVTHSELERFFNAGAFIHTDSIVQHDWGTWADVKPNSPEMAELGRTDELMFNYFAGDRGSRGIAWLPSKKKFVVVWRTGLTLPMTAQATPKTTVTKSKRKG